MNCAHPGAGLASPRRDLSIRAVGGAPRPSRKTQENTGNGGELSYLCAGRKSPADLNLVGLGKPSFPKRRVAPAQGPDWLLLTEI